MKRVFSFALVLSMLALILFSLGSCKPKKEQYQIEDMTGDRLVTEILKRSDDRFNTYDSYTMIQTMTVKNIVTVTYPRE